GEPADETDAPEPGDVAQGGGELAEPVLQLVGAEHHERARRHRGGEDGDRDEQRHEQRAGDSRRGVAQQQTGRADPGAGHRVSSPPRARSASRRTRAAASSPSRAMPPSSTTVPAETSTRSIRTAADSPGM